MPITSKYRCKTCDHSVIVEGETSMEIAMAEIMAHLEENRTHEVASPLAVWTDNPYIPPTE